MSLIEWRRIPDELFFQEGPGVRKNQYTNEGIKLLNVSNLVEGKVDLSTSDRFISHEEAYGKYKHFLCDEGDLIIASSGIKVEYFDKKMGFITREMLPLCMNTSTIRFKVKNEKSLDIRYFMYYLKSSDFKQQLNRQITGSAQLNFGPSHLDKMLFPICNLNEQKRIVKTLDAVNDLLEAYQKELDRYDELVKARFVEMFGDLKSNTKGWNINTFEELTYLITDGEHATPRRTDKGIYLLSARNVLNHSIQLENVDYIDQEEYDRIAKRVIPQAGDVLISCSGTVGRCCKVPEGLKFQMVRSAALLRFKEIINPVFAEYMVTSDYLQEQINSSKTASSQANLFQGKIKALKGIVPPRELQDEFADFVVQVDKSKLTLCRYNVMEYKCE